MANELDVVDRMKVARAIGGRAHMVLRAHEVGVLLDRMSDAATKEAVAKAELARVRRDHKRDATLLWLCLLSFTLPLVLGLFAPWFLA